MEEKRIDPIAAWDDFYSSLDIHPIPNEIVVAQATRNGKQKQNGKAKVLGVKRIRRLLEKYAPGKYVYHEGQPYFTK